MLKKIGVGASALVLGLGLAACSDDSVTEEVVLDDVTFEQEVSGFDSFMLNDAVTDNTVTDNAEITYLTFNATDDLIHMGIIADDLFNDEIYIALEDLYSNTIIVEDDMRDFMSSDSFNSDEKYVLGETYRVVVKYNKLLERYFSISNSDDREFRRLLDDSVDELAKFYDNIIMNL